jgi:Uma2 family endonuclease
MNLHSIHAAWLPSYTYKDYEKWEGDWELIQGIPYAMSPSPKRKHQAAGRRFMRIIEDALQAAKNACNCEVYYDLDWLIDEHTTIRPDVMLVCGAFNGDFLDFPPILTLEIFSDSSRLKDRNLKFRLYEESGVRYYLMADPDKETIEAFVLKNNRYEEFQLPANLTLTDSCTIELDLTGIWENV